MTLPADIFITLRNANRRYVGCTNEPAIPLEHQTHPQFEHFRSFGKKQMFTSSIYGITTSNTIWNIYKLTKNNDTKNVVFNWWLSQQPSPVEG
jgi:hypothetical protein